MDTLKTFEPARDHTRRATLAGLGGIALGGMVAPALAGKKTRKAVRRAKKKGKKKCRNQDGQCVAAMTTLCNAGNVDPVDAAACVTKFSACCAFLGDCQATSFLDCALSQ